MGRPSKSIFALRIFLVMVFVVDQIDARQIGRIDIFLVPSRSGMMHMARAGDHRFRHREEAGNLLVTNLHIHAHAERSDAIQIIVVEFLRDVAGQFQMLLLVLTHRHCGGAIKQDVGGHPDLDKRTGRARRFSRSLPALSLNWVMRLIQPMRAMQLNTHASSACCMTRLWLKTMLLFQVDTGSKESRGDFTGRCIQLQPDRAK